LLDVRSPAEFEAVHIPGAYNVPLDTLREHRDELRSMVRDEVVLVCRSGARAGQAERALAEVGMPNLHVLDGGMNAWQGLGAPVVRGRARWDLERQVRLVAGTLVLAGVLGGLVWWPLTWLSAGVGAGLAIAALTDTCVMGALLARLPYNRGAQGCDVRAVIGQLAGGPSVRPVSAPRDASPPR
jgi:rhodanese-related sulfurtransferase